MGQILVKVRDISVDDNGDPTLNHGTETVITYKAYGHTQDKFELIGQVEAILDSKGNPKQDQEGKFLYVEVPGNPNLNAQHRQAVQRNAGPVVKPGPTQVEIDQQEEIARLKALLADQNKTITAPVNGYEIPPAVAQSAPVEAQKVEQVRRKPGPKPKPQLKEQEA